MRDPPCELPRTWPGSNRSSSVTDRPRRARCHAAADPMAPAPTTTTSTRSTGRVLAFSARLRALYARRRAENERGQRLRAAEAFLTASLPALRALSTAPATPPVTTLPGGV